MWSCKWRPSRMHKNMEFRGLVNSYFSLSELCNFINIFQYYYFFNTEIFILYCSVFLKKAATTNPKTTTLGKKMKRLSIVSALSKRTSQANPTHVTQGNRLIKSKGCWLPSIWTKHHVELRNDEWYLPLDSSDICWNRRMVILKKQLLPLHVFWFILLDSRD